jgi:glycosyltransferase involved in cell wall biosynthesis
VYRNKRITVCLPCRNEGNHLKEVIGRIPSFVDEIIVISNVSSDNTMQVARKLGV